MPLRVHERGDKLSATPHNKNTMASCNHKSIGVAWSDERQSQRQTDIAPPRAPVTMHRRIGGGGTGPR